ncbi:Pre-rRNA-processing protein IPI3 [Aspergillus sclerotialis]|uniref:Pre-rRNA-processing protein IPI3 n=1 Tax=Aspergillus sclerotialis TaxID=2070753 RepID=A0A3A2ZNU8_9EURO|nr:Pre-rRNA-processing protein IPI3 [Aspergillus sclerotialis]
MLSECFVASTLASSKTPASATLRDVGICFHEFQPSPSLSSTFKKSSTHPNCLAVNSSHVFAAQAEKAIVHVYSRERGNQEATIPFPERIRSIAIAGGKNGDILVLGTEGGRLILWETCTGRQVATTPSHLQPVTSLVVDPISNFILSGSSDASIHVWSLVSILSFAKPVSGGDQHQSNSPIRTISNHRAAITSLAVGHSNGRYNIAVSTSKDNTAIAWDYRTGRILRTFLLPATALSVALDPVDRAFYVGYEDGSVQAVEFYKNQSIQHPLHDPSLQSTPTQQLAEERWLPPSSDFGATQALSVSYDGTLLLSGHESGKVLSWNVGRRKYASTVADYTHPVTNLLTQPPNGMPHPSLDLKRVSHTIVKPRYDQGLSDRSNTPGAVPGEYAFNTHILPSTSHQPVQASMVEEGLAELAALRHPGSGGVQAHPSIATTEEDTAKDTQISTLETELSTLRKKANINETARQATTDEMMKLRSDLASLQDYVNQLHEKQEQSHREKIQQRAKKEQRAARRREAWFAAEKKKRKSGDAAVKAMKAEDGESSSLDEMSSDE